MIIHVLYVVNDHNNKIRSKDIKDRYYILVIKNIDSYDEANGKQKKMYPKK